MYPTGIGPDKGVKALHAARVPPEPSPRGHLAQAAFAETQAYFADLGVAYALRVVKATAQGFKQGQFGGVAAVIALASEPALLVGVVGGSINEVKSRSINVDFWQKSFYPTYTLASIYMKCH